jgi:hypothetical protein
MRRAEVGEDRKRGEEQVNPNLKRRHEPRATGKGHEDSEYRMSSRGKELRIDHSLPAVKELRGAAGITETSRKIRGKEERRDEERASLRRKS